MQFASPVPFAAPHAVTHALAPQTKGVHALVEDPRHVPAPLQLPCVIWLPLEQDAATQIVEIPYFSQTPLAVHMPSVPQEAADCVAQRLRGFSPAVALPHVPFAAPLSVALQAVQVPLHATLQQNPSAQKPL
jgi:hypothetical protein